MKNLKELSASSNQLRIKFQKEFVEKYVREHGSLNGYNHQIYIMLPKFDRRLKLYRGVSKETYEEFRDYLFYQSQRRFRNSYEFQNGIMEINNFKNRDLNICYSRVWHNGANPYAPKRHWGSQIQALKYKIEKFGFTFYEHDYNFSSRSYQHAAETATPLLISIYSKLIEKKLNEAA